MTRVAIYSRQSTENDDQVKEHTRWCVERVERVGGTVVGPFEDDGISGFSGKTRPGYERMLAAVAAGEADAVMAVRYDRLLRNPREGVRLTEVLDAAGVSELLFIEEGNIDLSTAAGRSEVRKRVDGATYYADSLSEKVKGSKRRIARAGRWCGSPPYGYVAVNDHRDRRDGLSLAENDVEATVIREALAMVKSGDNLNHVVLTLRTRGYVTGWGKPWTNKALRRVLLSPAIAGIASLNNEELLDVEVAWSPIISVADYRLLQERLAVGAADRHPDAVNLRHVLAGILRCGLCSTKMYGTRLGDTGKTRYACSMERGGCGKVTVYGGVDRIAVQWVLTSLMVEGRVPVAEGVAADVHEAAAVELSAIAADRAKLNAVAESGMFTKAELSPKFSELKRREKTAKASLAKPVSTEFDPAKVAETIRERWLAYQDGDRDAAQLLHDDIALVLDHVDVRPYTPGTRKNVFDPERLTFHSKWLPSPLVNAVIKN
jgi:site-specific DNA recombinase